jgi:hypothetical protein
MPVSLRAYIVNEAAMMEIEAYFGVEVGCFCEPSEGSHSVLSIQPLRILQMQKTVWCATQLSGSISQFS